MSSEVYKEKLNGIVCLIKFIVLLDNNGKTIYSKFYGDEFNNQTEFISKLCSSTTNLNVAKEEVDIFTLNDYIIVSKISGEVNIFIGADDNENEVIVGNFFEIFEAVLSDIVPSSLTKENIINSYEMLIIAIDEMINDGVVMNANEDSINDIIKMKQNNNNGFISFGSSAQETRKSNFIFGSLLSGAKDYLSKSMNY